MGRIVEDSGDGTIMVEFAAGDTERVAADLIDVARAGDTVLVHMGFAISRIDVA
ncbi:MAG: HypC/HybG/HupF family hydrogenase formation chaperone [Gemmatimonadota bacterium]